MASLVANNSKMLAKDCRQQMRLKLNDFFETRSQHKDAIKVKPFHADRKRISRFCALQKVDLSCTQLSAKRFFARSAFETTMIKEFLTIMSVILALSFAASAASGTREDPIPMGIQVDLGDGWQVTVLSVLPDATNAVMQENQFNKRPAQGNQFFIARVRFTYLGEDSAAPSAGFRLRAVGPSSVGYSTFENSAGVIPDEIVDSELFTGGSVEGNVGWEIKSSDASSLVMYDKPLFGDSANRIYMALYGGQTSSVPTSSTNTPWEYRGQGVMGRN